jgi:excisionase family DNA binding protein
VTSNQEAEFRTPLLYKPEQAAAALGVGRSTVFELIADGSLPSVKIGRSRRVPRTALEAYVARLTGAASHGSAA